MRHVSCAYIQARQGRRIFWYHSPLNFPRHGQLAFHFEGLDSLVVKPSPRDSSRCPACDGLEHLPFEPVELPNRAAVNPQHAQAFFLVDKRCAKGTDQPLPPGLVAVDHSWVLANILDIHGLVRLENFLVKRTVRQQNRPFIQILRRDAVRRPDDKLLAVWAEKPDRASLGFEHSVDGSRNATENVLEFVRAIELFHHAMQRGKLT